MIQYYDWLPEMERVEGIDCLGHDLALFRYSDLAKDSEAAYLRRMLDGPHKFNFLVLSLVSGGRIRGRINLTDYDISGASLLRLLPEQIVQLEGISDDFDSMMIIMSHNFIGNLMVYMNGSVPLRLEALDDPVTKLDAADVKLYENLFNILRHIVRDRRNPYRAKVVEHVIMAFFYGSQRASSVPEQPKSNADVLSRKFYDLVRANFKKERQLKFYADKLCITPRYLSRVVKASSGASAADWIERSVILEARALLKSTNLTVQQISDELNFPSQTFFGKYFKRRVGMSPKEYRRVG